MRNDLPLPRSPDAKRIRDDNYTLITAVEARHTADKALTISLINLFMAICCIIILLLRI